MVLDGGKTSIGVESTVVDLTGNIPTILRPGGVLLEDLQNLLPAIQLRPVALNNGKTDVQQVSPGMLLKHYSPQADVQLIVGTPEKIIQHMQRRCRDYTAEGKSVGLLIAQEDIEHFQDLILL